MPASTGGSSLLLETDPSVMHMVTTIHVQEAVTGNRHDEAASALSGDYTVRSSSKFSDMREPDWLELAFPQLFPFGRGGFGERRQVPVSRERMLQHYLMLSSRSFLGWEYALHAYSMLVQKQLSTRAYVQARFTRAGGTECRADAFCKLSAEEAVMAAAYQEACSTAAKRNKPLPQAPASLSADAKDLISSISIVSKAAMHTAEFAMFSRVRNHGMHHTFSKPTWWVTLTVDDVCNFMVWNLALGQNPDEVPPKAQRFEILSDYPGAAALHFKRVMDVVVRHVLGWDSLRKAPFKAGGIFGILRAYTYCVEEQSRLSLHAHILAWMLGHRDFFYRLNEVRHDPLQFKDLMKQLETVLDAAIRCELGLPAADFEATKKCVKPGCDGEYKVCSNEMLLACRKRGAGTRHYLLQCNTCAARITPSSVLEAAIRNAGAKLGITPLDACDKTLNQLKWEGAAWKEPGSDKYKVLLAALQYKQNQHDPNHRDTCFKKGDTCRSKVPYYPVEETKSEPVYTSDPVSGPSSSQRNGVCACYSMRRFCRYLKNVVPDML